MTDAELDLLAPLLPELDLAVCLDACRRGGAVNAANALGRHITRMQIEIGKLKEGPSMQLATITISGTVSGIPSGNKVVGPLVISNINSTGDISEVTTINGNTTIAMPTTNCVGVLIVPPPGNAVALTLKGVNADTGLVLHPNNPTLYSFPPGTSSFVIAANGVTTLELSWF